MYTSERVFLKESRWSNVLSLSIALLQGLNKKEFLNDAFLDKIITHIMIFIVPLKKFIQILDIYPYKIFFYYIILIFIKTWDRIYKNKLYFILYNYIIFSLYFILIIIINIFILIKGYFMLYI